MGKRFFNMNYDYDVIIAGAGISGAALSNKLCQGGFKVALLEKRKKANIGEPWAQEKWLEISSVSTFEGYQAERLQLRYRSKDGKKQNVHTLNGSSLALPRVLATLLENCQTPDGIVLPKALVPYTGFEKID